MKYILALIIYNSSTLCLQAQTKHFNAKDGAYQIKIPQYWKAELPENSTIHFVLNASEDKNKISNPQLSLQVLTIPPQMQPIGLEKTAENDAKVFEGANKNITVKTNDFVTINNKRWWRYIVSVNISKKNVLTMHALETIHNGQKYILSFKAMNDDYNNFLPYESMYMFLFNDSDNTFYEGGETINDINNKKQQIEKFAGVYTNTIKDSDANEVRQTITFGKKANSKYNAIVNNEFTVNGSAMQALYTFRPLSIGDNEIIVEDDAVLHLDTLIPLTKSRYTIRVTDSGLILKQQSTEGRDDMEKDYVFKKEKVGTDIVNQDEQNPKQTASGIKKNDPVKATTLQQEVSSQTAIKKEPHVFDKVNAKRQTLNFSPVFTGSILKRWEGVARIVKGYCDYSRTLKSFEFLQGGNANIYLDGDLQSSGKYTLATDKKSVLFKDPDRPGLTMSVKIIKLTQDELFMKFENDTAILYAQNSLKAKAAMHKRALSKKASDAWRSYNTLIDQSELIVLDFFPAGNPVSDYERSIVARKNMYFTSGQSLLRYFSENINNYLARYNSFREEESMLMNSLSYDLLTDVKKQKFDEWNKLQKDIRLGEKTLVAILNEYYK